MIINEIKFIASHPSVGECPVAEMPEYAFIGRSNVGKSSLINYLADRKSIAKTSRTPGKTQLLNFFEADETWHLVDLPGYGYAKVSKKDRKRWEMMITNYLIHRQQLQLAFLLIDINVPAQTIDIEMINWMGEKNIPFSIIFTKCDKLSAGPLEQKLNAYEAELHKYWNELPEIFTSTSNKREGSEEILNYIHSINKVYYKNIKK